jgi:DNA-directed RNA polymerase specialized sigma24 family protein
VRAGLDGVRADALADELGMNRNAIYQARFRGFAALRKCMETGGLDMLDLSNGESAR